MSIYSTMRVSRYTAIQMVREKLSVEIDNERLGDLLDALYSSETLRNYLVYSEEVEEEES